MAVVAFVLALSLVRNTWVDVYSIPSASMEPLLVVGDRVLVSRTAFAGAGVRRGDVVVFDGRGSFTPPASGRGPVADALVAAGQWLGVVANNDIYVKRVLGVAGDTVKCCTAAGQLEVNGVPITEPYLYPHDAPSELRFEVRVPDGKLWLMGDHRAVSADSRDLLGAPGGGLVDVDRVIGRPVQVLWPPARIQSFPAR